MIAYIDGTIEFKTEKFVIVNVGGVGYKVYSNLETLHKIPEKAAFVNVEGGSERATASRRSPVVKFWTHQYIREDSVELYGFLHYAELELFETLIGISGIGPKGALGVLGIAPVDTLKKAIASGDTSYLTRVSGIGRKTAEKIVLELKEKMAGKGISGIEAPELREEADALDALVQLGYPQREAREMLQQVPQNISGTEKRLKEALKMINRKL